MQQQCTNHDHSTDSDSYDDDDDKVIHSATKYVATQAAHTDESRSLRTPTATDRNGCCC